MLLALAWANAWPIFVLPSNPNESPSSGSGATSADHTSSASAFGAWATRTTTFPTPHAAAAPMHSRNAPIGMCEPDRSAAISAMPASATTAPASWRAPGRSPRKRTARPTVNTALSCTTSDARPAGMPRWMLKNSRPN